MTTDPDKSGVYLINRLPLPPRRPVIELAEEEERGSVRERLKIYSVEEVSDTDGEAS